MLREAYAKYNAYPVGVSWWGVETVVSKKAINRMEDFKGVKFRSPQGMTAEILTKLGASIVVLPGGEVFSALEAATTKLGRTVNPTLYSRKELDQRMRSDNAFIKRVWSQPRLPVIGVVDELAA